MANAKLAPIHPGEVLVEDFLVPLGLSQYRLAKDISVPPCRINEIAHGKRSVSADTAIRLARYFGTSERFWLNLQAQYDSKSSTIVSAIGLTRKWRLAPASHARVGSRQWIMHARRRPLGRRDRYWGRVKAHRGPDA